MTGSEAPRRSRSEGPTATTRAEGPGTLASRLIGRSVGLVGGSVVRILMGGLVGRLVGSLVGGLVGELVGGLTVKLIFF